MKAKSEYPTRHGDQHLPWGSDPIPGLGGTLGVYQTTGGVFGSGQTIGTGSDTNLSFTYQYGAAVLDLTNPIEPAVVTSGVYAVTSEIQCLDGEQAGEFAWTFLVLDNSGFGYAVSSTWALASIGTANTVRSGISGTAYIPAGDSIILRERHEHGSSLHFYQQTFVQRIGI